MRAQEFLAELAAMQQEEGRDFVGVSPTRLRTLQTEAVQEIAMPSEGASGTILHMYAHGQKSSGLPARRPHLLFSSRPLHDSTVECPGAKVSGADETPPGATTRFWSEGFCRALLTDVKTWVRSAKAGHAKRGQCSHDWIVRRRRRATILLPRTRAYFPTIPRRWS